MLRVERASTLELGGPGFAIPIRAPGKIAGGIGPGALVDEESLVRPFRCDREVRDFVIAPPQTIARQGGFGVELLELGKVARELDLKRRSFSGKTEPAQFLRNPVDEEESLPPFFIGHFAGRLEIIALDQLPGGGNPE